MATSAEILRTAWEGYNAQVEGAAASARKLGIERDASFKPRLFASYLKSAWREHKGREAIEALVAAEAKQSPEVAAIRNELRVMDYTDGPINRDRYRDLQAQLMRLSAGQGAAA